MLNTRVKCIFVTYNCNKCSCKSSRNNQSQVETKVDEFLPSIKLISFRFVSFNHSIVILALKALYNNPIIKSKSTLLTKPFNIFPRNFVTWWLKSPWRQIHAIENTQIDAAKFQWAAKTRGEIINWTNIYLAVRRICLAKLSKKANCLLIEMFIFLSWVFQGIKTCRVSPGI